MAKKGRHHRSGRTTPKGTRQPAYRPQHEREAAGEPGLLYDLRVALADPHPLGLLALASSLLAALDPRSRTPIERALRKPEGPAREELLASFIGVDRQETSALLAAFAAMSTDELERRRIERELANRRHALPAWLDGIGDTKVDHPTLEMTHVLGDGDNVFVSVTFPGGHALTAVVYIDHNLGTLAKDAFLVPESLDDLLPHMKTLAEAGTSFNEIDPADARARITEAIALGAITVPPFESESWPACRPLVEWMVAMLPGGGTGYQRPEWDDQARDRLMDRFFASPFGHALDDADHRDLLHSLLWFGCDYGPGDPLRWSPVSVEILLVSWMPGKVIADRRFLSKTPDLLRAFVRFCHAERAIPSPLTEQTLASVDRWEPAFQAAISSTLRQGTAGLLAAAGLLDMDEYDDAWDDEDWDDDDEDDELVDYADLLWGWLEEAVGGREALMALDDEPLPDEPMRWEAIADDIRDRVAEVLELTDRCCDDLLDHEYRTVCRRVLARIAVRGPEVFRRRGRTDTAAAAICWAVGRANGAFDQRAGGLTNKALLAHLGVQQGSISQRAATLLTAGGFPQRAVLGLGSPEFIVSGQRRLLISQREEIGSLLKR